MIIRAPRRAAPWLAPALAVALTSPASATMPPHSGPVPPEVSRAFTSGLFDVPSRAPGLGTSASREDWVIPIIRVEFTDSAIVHTKAALERRLFDTTHAEPTGSAAEYYRWASGGRLRLRGEVVATVRLPHDRYYYSYDSWGVNTIATPNNDYGMFRDAVAACDATVDFSRFDLDGDSYVDMLWLVHAGPPAEVTGRNRDLWSITARATAGWNNGSAVVCNDFVPGSELHIRIDRFTVLPELSGLRAGQLSEIGVYCHEFGHTLGLPDLYDTSVLGGAANVGPGNWALMATGAYGGDGLSPEKPSHLGAWSLLWLGWANRIRPTRDTTIVLPPVVDGTPILEFWFQGEDSPEHFLIENRVREGFDQNLPNDGLVVHQVDEAVVGPRLSANRINTGPTPGMRILEADGNFDLYHGWNRGDWSDPFPGLAKRTRIDDATMPSTRTFAGAPTNVSIENIARVGRNVSMRLNVRAPGWQSARDLAPGAGAPELTYGPAAKAAVSRSGRAWHVSSEALAGRDAIVVRERPWLGAWSPPVAVDRGLGAASEPTLARLEGDNLAVAWIEKSPGVYEICFRTRLFGRWGPARVLRRSTEGCFTPAIAADARGRIYLSWLEVINGYLRLQFQQFLYAAPYGQPTLVTNPVDLPAPPAVTAAGDGHAYVLWPDRGSGTHVVYACRFDPDSGLSERFRLGSNSAYAQSAVSAAVDSSGTLYSVWQVSPGAGSEIHFQKRPSSGRPTPRDTTLDSFGDGLQNPRLALDATGGIHVAYERSVSSGQQIRYKRWNSSLGWDHRATEVTEFNAVLASGINLLPTSSGNVDVIWIAFDGNVERLRERARFLDGSQVTDVPEPAPQAWPALSAGPNPLRAGQTLEFAGDGVRAGAVIELIDAAGRRVAAVTADAAGRARLERDATAPLAAGLYFVRVRGSDVRGRVVVLR